MRKGMTIVRCVLAATLLMAAPTLSAPTLAGSGPPAPAPGTSARIDAIRQRGTLRVAVLDEYPWLKKKLAGAGSRFEGAAWLLAEDYAKRLGVRLETTPVGFDDKVSILSSDQVDITVVPLLETPARAQEVDFITYSKAAHCLFGRADNPKVARANSIGDLDRPDVTIGFINGTPQGAWAQDRLPRAARHGMPGTIADLATSAVVAGTADVAPIDQFFFVGLSKKLPGLVTIPRGAACLRSTELPLPIGMAVSKGQPVFLAWLRAEAEAVELQVQAEQARVVAEGP